MENFKDNVQESKEETSKRLKASLEDAKLKIIYAQLEEENIECRKDYSSVKELKEDLKVKLYGTEYNKIAGIVDGVNNGLSDVVDDLIAGSTSKFEKFITSDLSKSVAKAFGISLAGRTALLLAPTLVSKLAVSGVLTGRTIYRLVKNSHDAKDVREENALNNILTQLECTSNSNGIVDTRFDQDTQEYIKDFLKRNDIIFNDTGYRSMRAAIYNLDFEQKKTLCVSLNGKLNKGILIDEELTKARKSKITSLKTAVNVTRSGIVSGAGAAVAINSVDPALSASVINGVVLEKFLDGKLKNSALEKTLAGFGGVSSAVLERLPVIGSSFEKMFSIENIACLSTVGASCGLAASAVLGVIGTIKGVKDHFDDKKAFEEFDKLDREKYQAEDFQESENIKKILDEVESKKSSSTETIYVDFIVEVLKDKKIYFDKYPVTLKDLEAEIHKLPTHKRNKAVRILEDISEYNKNGNYFITQLKKAMSFVSGLSIAGFAGLSIVDIIKGGNFLPSLSQKLWPENNIYTPQEKVKELLNPKMAKYMSDDQKREQLGEIKDMNAVYQNSKVLMEDQTERTTEGVVKEVGKSIKQDAKKAVGELDETGRQLKKDVINFVKGYIFKDEAAKQTFYNEPAAFDYLTPDATISAVEAVKNTKGMEYMPDSADMAEYIKNMPSQKLVDLFRFYYTNNIMNKEDPNFKAMDTLLGGSTATYERAAKYVEAVNKAIERNNIQDKLLCTFFRKLGDAMVVINPVSEVMTHAPSNQNIVKNSGIFDDIDDLEEAQGMSR